VIRNTEAGSKFTPLYIRGSFKESYQPTAIMDIHCNKILVDLQVPIFNTLLLKLQLHAIA